MLWGRCGKTVSRASPPCVMHPRRPASPLQFALRHKSGRGEPAGGAARSRWSRVWQKPCCFQYHELLAGGCTIPDPGLRAIILAQVLEKPALLSVAILNEVLTVMGSSSLEPGAPSPRSTSSRTAARASTATCPPGGLLLWPPLGAG